MKPFTSHLDKLVENTKDHSTCRSAEQTAQDKEITASSLQDKLAIQQEKAYHHASHTVEKRRKHQIPFIALALVMLFMSLSIISVAGLRPVALADKLTHLDATPTATPDLSNVPVDQSVSDLLTLPMDKSRGFFLQPQSLPLSFEGRSSRGSMSRSVSRDEPKFTSPVSWCPQVQQMHTER